MGSAQISPEYLIDLFRQLCNKYTSIIINIIIIIIITHKMFNIFSYVN